MSELILFLDFETTGLSVEYDGILEVGACVGEITRHDGTVDIVEQAALKAIVDPRTMRPGLMWDDVIPPNCEDVVREMHSATNLWHEARAGVTLYEAEDVLWDLVADHMLDVSPEGAQVVLGGAGVSHFDHDLLKRRFPQVAKVLYYATVDVSVGQRLAKLAGEYAPRWDPPYGTVHRALDDARIAMDDTCSYLRWLRRVEDPLAEPRPTQNLTDERVVGGTE